MDEKQREKTYSSEVFFLAATISGKTVINKFFPCISLSFSLFLFFNLISTVLQHIKKSKTRLDKLTSIRDKDIGGFLKSYR